MALGAYQPFPPFSAWSGLTVGADWDRYRQRVDAARARRKDEEVEEVTDGLRLASLDSRTPLYIDPTDDAPPSPLVPYGLVREAARGVRPIDVDLIRRLHAELCRTQRSYESRTPAGVTLRPFEPGVYKREATALEGAEGPMRICAPVERTPAEVERLVAEASTDGFRSAHPVLQASYLLYALLQIHPFPDGNGRVARALASVCLERAASLPFLLLAGHYDSYILALEAIEPEPIVDFVYERGIDVMLVAADVLAALDAPTPETVAELEGAATGPAALSDSVVRTLALGALSDVMLSLDNAGIDDWSIDSPPLTLTIIPMRGASAAVTIDIARDDDTHVRLEVRGGRAALEIRAADVSPSFNPTLAVRISVWARWVVGELLEELTRHRAAASRARERN